MNIILGGGLTGLTAAYELTKKGEEAIVIEKEDQLGGLLASIKRDGYYIEKYYHHIFKNYANVIELLKELGLDGKLEWREASSGFFDERLYRLSSPFDLLSYRPLSIRDKLDLARIMLRMKSIKDPIQFDGITAEDWIIENSSRRVYEKFFKPLVLSKYEGYSNISASWFIERMKLRNQRSISGERLGYLRGGFEQMIQRMVKKIKDNGGEIRLSKTVSSIKAEGKKIKSVKMGSETIKSDNVISTINPERLEKLVAGFKKPEVKYQGSACVLLALKKQLHPYYWTNIIKPELNFGAVIEHTNFMPPEDYGGEHLVYLASYPGEKSRVWAQSDGRVFESYLGGLKRIFRLDKKDILKWWVFRTKESGIVFETGTAKNMVQTTTGFENLFIGGVFNSYPERSSDESVRIGIECARKAVGD